MKNLFTALKTLLRARLIRWRDERNEKLLRHYSSPACSPLRLKVMSAIYDLGCEATLGSVREHVRRYGKHDMSVLSSVLAINALEEMEMIASYDGEGRRYYHLLPAGMEAIKSFYSAAPRTPIL